MGYISTDKINQKLAEKLAIPLVSLKHFEVDLEVMNKVPPDFCKRYHILPLFVINDHLVIALDDLLNFDAIEMVRFISGQRVDMVLAKGCRKD